MLQGMTFNMRKDEKYIKGVLEDVFSGVGNFQRFEYQMFSGSCRPDFVILDDDEFTYFEIKSEFDTFARFREQMKYTSGYFTRNYLVVPEEKREEAMKYIDYSWGIHILEDLESGILEPRRKCYNKGTIWGDNLSSMLWKDEKKKLIKDRAKEIEEKPFLFRDGKKKALSKMMDYELDMVFPIFFDQRDSVKILNDVLPNRFYS